MPSWSAVSGERGLRGLWSCGLMRKAFDVSVVEWVVGSRNRADSPWHHIQVVLRPGWVELRL